MERQKIYTRKGDSGETALLGGKKVSKSNLRIEVFGEVDELNSFLGLFLAQWEYAPPHTEVIDFLTSLQHELFVVGAQMAAPAGSGAKIPILPSSSVRSIEEWIDRLDEQCLPLESFILPGGHVLASWAHVLRSISRRVERSLVKFEESEGVAVPGEILPYFNRLSDFFFVLARYLNKEFNVTETKWVPQ